MYAYDGEGLWVMKTAGTQTTVYVYDAAGNLAAEYGSTAASGTQYLTSDHLGSTWLVTGAGGVVLERHDYTPFGEDLCAENGRGAIAEYTAGCANTAVRQEFTGKKRDAETGLDWFDEIHVERTGPLHQPRLCTTSSWKCAKAGTEQSSAKS